MDFCYQQVENIQEFVKICLAGLKQMCHKSRINVISVHSINMQTITHLLEVIPDLKVIYFIRDPRAIFHSKVKAGLVQEHEAERTSRSLCAKMSEDTVIVKQIQKQNPESIKVVCYEDFAENLLRKATLLLSVLDLKHENEVIDHVRDMSMRGRDTECHWCSIKGSSNLAARAWRKDISYLTVLTIDRECQAVYREQGYVKAFDEKQLRRLTFPLHKVTFLTSNKL